MHDYSIDRHPKEKILFVVAFAAISAAPLLNDLIHQLVTYLEVSTGWSSPPVTAIPVFALFLVIYLFFDRYLWKVRLFRKFLLVPDLNGKWTCSGQTTLKEGKSVNYEWEGEITITQSWSKILVHLKTENSRSRSISGSLFHEVGVGFRFLYQYNNDPDADQLDLSKHSGSSEILFSEDCKSGMGHYFTDQHRRTVGTLNLKRKR
ncbi:MAG: hypothetical protein AB7E73_04345 [Burkholderiales bacterium]